MERCPVCLEVIPDGAQTCEHCNFHPGFQIFLNKDQYFYWKNTVLEPAREKWNMKKAAEKAAEEKARREAERRTAALEARAESIRQDAGVFSACCLNYDVLLHTDGRVSLIGEYGLAEETVARTWTDIVAIAGGKQHFLGLRSDGTVLAAGDNRRGQCSTGEWKDIVRVLASGATSVGITRDGSLLACGANSERIQEIARKFIGANGCGTDMRLDASMNETQLVLRASGEDTARVHYEVFGDTFLKDDEKDAEYKSVGICSGGTGSFLLLNGSVRTLSSNREAAERENAMTCLNARDVKQLAVGQNALYAFKADGTVWFSGLQGWKVEEGMAMLNDAENFIELLNLRESHDGVLAAILCSQPEGPVHSVIRVMRYPRGFTGKGILAAEL